MDQGRSVLEDAVDLVLLQVADHMPCHIGKGRVATQKVELACELLRPVLAKGRVAGRPGSRDLVHIDGLAHGTDGHLPRVAPRCPRGLRHPFENLGAALPYLLTVLFVIGRAHGATLLRNGCQRLQRWFPYGALMNATAPWRPVFPSSMR